MRPLKQFILVQCKNTKLSWFNCVYQIEDIDSQGIKIICIIMNLWGTTLHNPSLSNQTLFISKSCHCSLTMSVWSQEGKAEQGLSSLMNHLGGIQIILWYVILTAIFFFFVVNCVLIDWENTLIWPQVALLEGKICFCCMFFLFCDYHSEIILKIKCVIFCLSLCMKCLNVRSEWTRVSKWLRKTVQQGIFIVHHHGHINGLSWKWTALN